MSIPLPLNLVDSNEMPVIKCLASEKTRRTIKIFGVLRRTTVIKMFEHIYPRRSKRIVYGPFTDSKR